MLLVPVHFELLTQGSYGEDFIGITPKILKEPTSWCAPAGTIRPASETKGATHSATGECCSDESTCC
ncbi:MAG: hypothetical protein Q9N32_06520 [Gammaproteobacteria bacterium]|nr:hypothetical protein [Gammaproteobacteria bacterium]